MSTRPAPALRSADLRLAGLHVRGGSYALARVELETLAGADALDADGVLDLAEVRWRTGDLAGAEAAAAAWLEEAAGERHGGAVLANAICAEAAVERGDPGAAAAHVESAAAGLAAPGALELLLAGIPSRAPWPEVADAAPVGVAAAPAAAVVGAAVGAPAAAPVPHVVAAAAPIVAGSGAPPIGVPLTPAAGALVAAGAALLAEAPERAAVLLALALRADRGAAEAVLAALGAAAPDGIPAGSAPAGGATVAFVRGEALRAAGRHEEARIAYASAERLALAPAEAGPSGSPQ